MVFTADLKSAGLGHTGSSPVSGTKYGGKMIEDKSSVLQEKADLDSKIEQLSKFIGSDVYLRLDTSEQERLNRQHLMMRSYSSILSERIEHFTN